MWYPCRYMGQVPPGHGGVGSPWTQLLSIVFTDWVPHLGVPDRVGDDSGLPSPYPAELPEK